MEWLFLPKNGCSDREKNFQLFPINCTCLAIVFQEIPALFGVKCSPFNGMGGSG